MLISLAEVEDKFTVKVNGSCLDCDAVTVDALLIDTVGKLVLSIVPVTVGEVSVAPFWPVRFRVNVLSTSLAVTGKTGMVIVALWPGWRVTVCGDVLGMPV